MALSCAGLITGCATFKGSRGIDVGPFAENTVGMIGEVQRIGAPLPWVHLKKYQSLPSVQEARQATLPTRNLLRGIGLYSTQLVSIYSSPISESRKVAALARYIREYVRPALESSERAGAFLSLGEMDSAITAMESAESFLDAASAAQPVVSAALAFGNSIYDGVSERVDVAAAEIALKIEEEFAPLKEQKESLETLHMRGMRSYTLLRRYRQGESAALETLRSFDAEVADLLPEGKKPSNSALDTAEQAVLNRIGNIRSLREQLAPDFDDYQAEIAELDQLRAQARESVRLGRITLILWARSHQNLAAGIRIPAAIDVMGMVRGAATKAVAFP